MVSAILTSGQIALIFFVIIFSVLSTCFVISRLRFLPSLDNPGGRYTHVDGLRGIAALCVFLNHTPLIVLGMGIMDNYIRFPNTHIESGLGALGVQIFFCITGFLFSEKILKAKNEMDWGKFFTNRIRRLVPLYFFVVTAVIFLSFLLRSSGTPINIGHTFISGLKAYSFGFIPFQPLFGFDIESVLGNVWTLAYEWRFYLLMPVFFWLLKDGGPWRVAFGVLMVMAIIDLSASQKAVWPFFLGGFIAAVILNRVQLQHAGWRWFCTVLAILILALPFFDTTHDYGLQRWLTTSIGFILIILAEPAFLKLRILRFLGEISYSFYLLGLVLAFFIFNTLSYYKNLSSMPFMNYLGWEMIIAVSAIVVSTLTFRYIEYPFLRKKKTQSDGAPILPVPLIIN